MELRGSKSLISFLCWLLSPKFHNILGRLFLVILVFVYKRAIGNDGMTAGSQTLNDLFHKGYGSCFLVGTGSGSILNMGLQRVQPENSGKQLVFSSSDN